VGFERKRTSGRTAIQHVVERSLKRGGSRSMGPIFFSTRCFSRQWHFKIQIVEHEWSKKLYGRSGEPCCDEYGIKIGIIIITIHVVPVVPGYELMKEWIGANKKSESFLDFFLPTPLVLRGWNRHILHIEVSITWSVLFWFFF
jgi:hypothetical protein